MNTDRKKYLVVLIITSGIFVVVFFLIHFLNKEKIININDLQRKITVDLIATETQFDLLKTAPCDSLENTLLSQELNELGRKLDFTENNQGSNRNDVLQLKKYYSLLQVKDYLLMQEFAEKCDITIDSILYFYSSDCPLCTKQGYVLTEFKKRYPKVRIYSFDTGLDFSVINTFASLYNFKEVYPTLITDEKVFQEFIDIEKLIELFPELVLQKELKNNIEDGIKHILNLEIYDNLSKDDIVFKEIKGNHYLYSQISPEDEEIILLFNTETKEFSLEPPLESSYK